ncbi:hypothetical protein [Candidatus Palauibacter sp.]|uniref:hypothetical protein n=1 Tax=Candidatus Palauibacter sp. TaxID=3101350 RepID=UPI003B02922B
MKNPPDGWPRITPAVFYDDAGAAIDWLASAFGFEVQERIENEQGQVVHPQPPFSRVRSSCRRALMVFTVLLSASGCRTDRSHPPEPVSIVERDSAGVRIIEFGLNVWESRPTWSVSTDPRIELRGSNRSDVSESDRAAYEFFDVSGLARLLTGELVVADNGTRELRMFGDDGRYLRTLGSEGEGPGEFTDLAFLDIIRGDSLATFDGHLHRITVMDPRSGGARLVNSGARMATHLLKDGGVVWEERGGSFHHGAWSDSVTVVRTGSDGMTTDSIGVFDGTEFFYTAGTVYVEHRPFGRQFRTAARDSVLYVATGDQYSILVFSARGHRTAILRGLFATRPVAAEEFDDMLSMWISDSRDPRRQTDLEKLRGTKPYPDMVPPHGELMLAATGELFVQDFTWRPDEGQVWRVFDPSHRPRATLKTPPGFRVLYVDELLVGGVGMDEYGVERVMFYEIIRD